MKVSYLEQNYFSKVCWFIIASYYVVYDSGYIVLIIILILNKHKQIDLTFIFIGWFVLKTHKYA